MASIFLDLVCSVHVVTITNGVNYSFMICFKSGFDIHGPIFMVFIFMDLVCSVHLTTITNGINYSVRISFKNGFNISGPSMFSIWENLPRAENDLSN